MSRYHLWGISRGLLRLVDRSTIQCFPHSCNNSPFWSQREVYVPYWGFLLPGEPALWWSFILIFTTDPCSRVTSCTYMCALKALVMCTLTGLAALLLHQSEARAEDSTFSSKGQQETAAPVSNDSTAKWRLYTDQAAKFGAQVCAVG